MVAEEYYRANGSFGADAPGTSGRRDGDPGRYFANCVALREVETIML